MKERIFGLDLLHDLTSGSPGCYHKKRTLMLHLQNLKFLFQFFFLLSSTKHTLDLVNVKFHVFQIFGKKNPPFMQKPDMVADILQFAQIVRRDHRSKFPVHDLRLQTGSLLPDALPDQVHQRSHRKTDISLPRTHR